MSNVLIGYSGGLGFLFDGSCQETYGGLDSGKKHDWYGREQMMDENEAPTEDAFTAANFAALVRRVKAVELIVGHLGKEQGNFHGKSEVPDVRAVQSAPSPKPTPEQPKDEDKKP
jgi:hypothetical protein